MTPPSLRSIAYFDRLGRQFLGASETFNRYDATTSNDWAAACTAYDNRGRTIRVSEPFFATASNDGQGLPGITGSAPCSTATAWTRTKYDEFDRSQEITLPEHTEGAPARTSMVYSGLTTTTTVQVMRDETGDGMPDAVTMQKIEILDATGKVVEVRDNAGLVAYYSYDAHDNLVSLSRDAGNGPIVSTIQYDELGRKKEQSDPDAGTVKYRYNPAGDVICQSDARGFATITDYDALGRAWRNRVELGSCVSVTATAVVLEMAAAMVSPATGASRSIGLTVFDNDGTRVQLGLPLNLERRQTTGSVYGLVDIYKQSTTYDTLGRPQQTTTIISPTPGGAADAPYVQSTTYDALGRAATVTDPTGGVVENMYSTHGFLRRVRDGANPSIVYWELQETDARGQVTQEQRHANAKITTRRAYNASTGRLQSIRTGELSGTSLINAVQDLAYNFDAMGDLLSRQDLRLRLEERFSYDRLNRLLGGELRGINGNNQLPLTTISLQYDKLGNICTKNGRAYTYGGRAGCGLGVPGSGSTNGSLSPHAVTQRAMANGGFVSYFYDTSGNQITADSSDSTGADRSVRYNGDGLADRISATTTGSPAEITEFRYGPSGRYLRIDDGADGYTVTRYVGGVEWMTGTRNERRRNIGGFLVLIETGLPSAPERKYRYQLTDHLGSVDTLVDESGIVVERLSFDAHGNRRAADGTGSWQSLLTSYNATNTTHGFTGHEHVDRAGIIHMNGRLYDPQLGRMLSPDPIVQEPLNAQNLNRYTYVLNNPLSFTDPSGLSFLKDNWRQIVSIVIVIFAPYLGFVGFWGNVVTGFVSGAVASGSLQGGLWGAFSAGVFSGIGAKFKSIADANAAGGAASAGKLINGLKPSQFAAKVLSHAAAGGVMSKLQGGKFGHGFASAGVTQALSPTIGGVDRTNQGFSSARVAVAAMVGGTTSVLSGGKFANGAITAAFSRAFNDELHFDGSTLRAYSIGDDGARSLTHEWDAFSGMPGSTPEDQYTAYKGPIPEGYYWVDPTKTDYYDWWNPKDWDWLGDAARTAWGDIRTPGEVPLVSRTPMKGDNPPSEVSDEEASIIYPRV